MAITGRAAGPPLGAPSGFVDRLRALEATLMLHSTQVGAPLEIDALGLLGERAALAGLQRGGDRSCGGATRLLPSRDGWLAVSLPRPSDIELLPAWLGHAGLSLGEDPWDGVARAVADRDAISLAVDAALLGLPVAALPMEAADLPPASRDDRCAFGSLPVIVTAAGAAPPAALAEMLVADLSSLWAGPLCAQLLGLAGARIVKIESTSRPDGARFGPAAFFDLLHAGHESVALDFTSAKGRDDLRRLLDAADVVIEASRPRALQQLGIDADALLRDGRARLWLSVTGYGRTGSAAQRVAFGDDGAVAGGLVVWDDDGPCFCADAVADPLTGLVAAAAVLGALAAGGRWLLDVSLRGVAAYFAADAAASPAPAIAARPDGTVPTTGGPVPVAPPRARSPRGTAAPLGTHTEAVLAELHRGRR
jgi:hypothetical protein